MIPARNRWWGAAVAVLTSWMVFPLAATAASDPVEKAKLLIEKQRYEKAVRVLEGAEGGAPGQAAESARHQQHIAASVPSPDWCIDLLRALYGTVIAPPAVARELRAGAEKGVDVPDVSALPWLEVRPAIDPNLLPMVVDLGSAKRKSSRLASRIPAVC